MVDRRTVLSQLGIVFISGCVSTGSSADTNTTTDQQTTNTKTDTTRTTKTTAESTATISDPPSKKQLDGPLISVEYYLVTSTRKFRYYNSESESLEFIQADYGTYTQPHINIKNLGNEDIPKDKLKNVKMVIGGEVYAPVNSLAVEWDNIRLREVNAGFQKPGTDLHNPDTLEPGDKMTYMPMFDVPDGNGYVIWEYNGKHALKPKMKL